MDIGSAARATPPTTSAERSLWLDAAEPPGYAPLEGDLDVDLVDDIDLPFSTYGAVRLADQLQLQPVDYVRGLARAVQGDGSHVLEATRVKGIQSGDPCRLRTEHGRVAANQVVDAAHYPLLDRGVFFARLEPTRS